MLKSCVSDLLNLSYSGSEYIPDTEDDGSSEFSNEDKIRELDNTSDFC